MGSNVSKVQYTLSIGDRKITPNLRAKLDFVEVLSANGAAVGSFHPGFQAFVMQIMSTGQ